MDVSTALPEELRQFFVDYVTNCGEVSLGEGSLVQTHVDSSNLLEYKKNSYCILSEVNATEGPMPMLYRKYEHLFDSYEVESLTTVYQTLYPGVSLHIPMRHERFHQLRVFGETFISLKSKGSQSSAVCANWAGVGGNIATANEVLRVSLVQYFFRHTILLSVSASTESKKVKHISARVSWYKPHPRENWFHDRTLPVSRILCCCAIIQKLLVFVDLTIVSDLFNSFYSLIFCCGEVDLCSVCHFMCNLTNLQCTIRNNT